MAINHTIRTKDGPKTVKLTCLRAIRLFCHECMGWNWNEVSKCTAPMCPLFPYKSGRTGRKKVATIVVEASKRV